MLLFGLALFWYTVIRLLVESRVALSRPDRLLDSNAGPNRPEPG